MSIIESRKRYPLPDNLVKKSKDNNRLLLLKDEDIYLLDKYKINQLDIYSKSDKLKDLIIDNYKSILNYEDIIDSINDNILFNDNSYIVKVVNMSEDDNIKYFKVELIKLLTQKEITLIMDMLKEGNITYNYKSFGHYIKEGFSFDSNVIIKKINNDNFRCINDIPFLIKDDGKIIDTPHLKMKMIKYLDINADVKRNYAFTANKLNILLSTTDTKLYLDNKQIDLSILPTRKTYMLVYRYNKNIA